MAKRFGRNQRRKLREEVGRLKHDLVITGTQYQKTAVEADKLRRSVAALIAELPEGSALKVELDEIAVHSGYMRGMQMAPRPGSFGPLSRSVQFMPHEQVAQLVDLMAYRISCEPDLVSHRLRFRVDTTDDCAAYMVDREFFRKHGFSPRMVEEMGARIAMDLASYFGPGHGRG